MGYILLLFGWGGLYPRLISDVWMEGAASPPPGGRRPPHINWERVMFLGWGLWDIFYDCLILRCIWFVIEYIILLQGW